MISFTIPGVPIPQPRPSVTRTGRVFYKANGCREWRQAIALTASRLFPVPDDGPWKIQAVYIFERPPSHYTKSGKLTRAAKAIQIPPRPDVDNLNKALNDALEGVIYNNDSQIGWQEAGKVYGDKARTEVTIRRF